MSDSKVVKEHTDSTAATCLEEMKTMADILKESGGLKESGWTTVEKSKKKRKQSKTKSEVCTNIMISNLKAADPEVPLFLSNVNKDAKPDDVVNHVKNKTGESVLVQKINMKNMKKYDACKIMVSRHIINQILKDGFWPDGITCKRFQHYSKRHKVLPEIVKPQNG